MTALPTVSVTETIGLRDCHYILKHNATHIIAKKLEKTTFQINYLYYQSKLLWDIWLLMSISEQDSFCLHFVERDMGALIVFRHVLEQISPLYINNLSMNQPQLVFIPIWDKQTIKSLWKILEDYFILSAKKLCYLKVNL